MTTIIQNAAKPLPIKITIPYVHVPHILGLDYIDENIPATADQSAEEEQYRAELNVAKAYIQDQYKALTLDCKAIKVVSTRILDYVSDDAVLLKYALSHMPNHIDDLTIDLKTVVPGINSLRDDTPHSVKTLRLVGGNHSHQANYRLQAIILDKLLPLRSEENGLLHLDLSDNDLRVLFKEHPSILGTLPETLKSLDLSYCGLEWCRLEHLHNILKPLPASITKIAVNGIKHKLMIGFREVAGKIRPNILSLIDIISCTSASIVEVEFNDKYLDPRFSPGDIFGELSELRSNMQISLCSTLFSNFLLPELYHAFSTCLGHKDKSITIIADNKLYGKLQTIKNFQALLEQVADFMMDNPDILPSADNPIIPRTMISSDVWSDYTDILQATNFNHNAISSFTLALLYSNGIESDYAIEEVSYTEKLIRDKTLVQLLGEVSKNYSISAPLKKQILSVIQKMADEYHVSMRIPHTARKYRSKVEHELAQAILDELSIDRDNDSLFARSQEQANSAVVAISNLFDQLSELRVDRPEDFRPIRHILEQMHHFIDKFIKFNESKESLQYIYELFARHPALRHLDHETLNFKCTGYYDECIAKNSRYALARDIYSPSAEILIGLRIKCILAKIYMCSSQEDLEFDLRALFSSADNSQVEVMKLYVELNYNYTMQQSSIVKFFKAAIFAIINVSDLEDDFAANMNRALQLLTEVNITSPQISDMALTVILHVLKRHDVACNPIAINYIERTLSNCDRRSIRTKSLIEDVYILIYGITTDEHVYEDEAMTITNIEIRERTKSLLFLKPLNSQPDLQPWSDDLIADRAEDLNSGRYACYKRPSCFCM